MLNRPFARPAWSWRYLVALALSLVGLAARPADTPSDTLTPDRVARLRSVSEVAVSPDGRHVAYTVGVPRQPGVDDDGEPWAELWLYQIASGEKRPFITGKVNVAKPAWTADSRHIAFLAKRGDDKFKALYWIPVDGGEARKAAELKTDVSDYSLAPDGLQVALVGTPAEEESRKKQKDKGFKQEVFEEDLRNARVWIARAFDTNAAGPRLLEVTGSVRLVQWSPVGDALALAVTPTASVDDGMMRQQVVVVDPATGAVTARVNPAAKLGAVTWSRDGRRLGLIAGNHEHDPSAGRLMVVPSAGGTLKEAVPGFDGDFLQVHWVGADDLLAVVGKGVGAELVRLKLRVDGEELSSSVSAVGAVLGSFGVSTNGQTLAFLGQASTHPAELFVSTAGEGVPPTRRTDSNPDLAGVRWARQEVVRYRARDGLELEGILIRPRDAAAGTRVPLILAVHGGPEAHVSDGWLTSYSYPGQVAAARGFAVFYPNYRGSTGRGVKFSKLGQGDAAGKEFDDLVDAVDHLVKTGLVDPERVGITGGSYGGYATAWCSTRYSERFAAGVMFVGISDKVSKVGTTDIPDEEYLVHALQRPWDNWQFLLERSPIYHAGNCRTPLLILHGADDPRVHPAQSKEMYRHLKLRSQAPVRLVMYPGEGHGNRKAAARYDYHLRMLQWFEHYLKGAGGPMPGKELDYALPAAEKP